MLRLRHVAYEGKHPPLEMGQLVFYTMGVVGSNVERTRAVVECQDNEAVPLDLHRPRTNHELFVQWYPYVRDKTCRDRRVQRRAAYGSCEDLRRPAHTLTLPVLGEPDERLVVHLTWDTTPPDGNWGSRVTEWPKYQAMRQNYDRVIQAYLENSTQYYAARRLRPCAADPDVRGWPGSVAITPAGKLPMAALAQAASELKGMISPELLRHWCWMAATRLNLPRTIERRDALIELMCDVATTRLWTLAYQTDTSLGGRIIDDWAHISETPDSAAAAYDCEDGSFDILSVLRTLEQTPRNPRHPGIMERVADVARQYVFMQALGRMRSGDTVVWHSYVIGLDENVVARALGSSVRETPTLPAVLIESTQYTTSLWSFDSEATTRGAMLVDDQNLSDVLHVKIPGSLMRACGAQQYLQTFALFLPTWHEKGGAEVVLHERGQDVTYGVDTAAFLADPTGCDWRVVPGWSGNAELRHALDTALMRMPPWPSMWTPHDAGFFTNFSATGSVAYMRPADYALLPERWPYVDTPLYVTNGGRATLRLVALEGRIDAKLNPARKPWKQ